MILPSLNFALQTGHWTIYIADMLWVKHVSHKTFWQGRPWIVHLCTKSFLHIAHVSWWSERWWVESYVETSTISCINWRSTSNADCWALFAARRGFFTQWAFLALNSLITQKINDTITTKAKTPINKPITIKCSTLSHCSKIETNG